MVQDILARLAEHVEAARRAEEPAALRHALTEAWFALHEASEAANDPNYLEAAMAARSMEHQP
jgi:hypothetical protein